MTEESRRLGWLDESVQEGQSWLKVQRGYTDIQRSFNIVSGKDVGPLRAEYRSAVNTCRLRRNVREVVGALAKLRPMWGYHSDNSAYKENASMFNRVTRAWYLEAFADLSILEALQYASVTARGWVRPIYRRDMHGTGHGDIKLLTYGSPCVLPIQLPASGDWQSAYAVTILDEMPVAMAHGMFPKFQERLRPSSSRYWYANDGVRKAAQSNIMTRIFGRGPRAAGSEGLSDLLVPVRYTYVIDLSINTTKAEIPMGELGSSWAYTVPYLGQPIPTGKDLASGKPTHRFANENDCRLYPYRRLLISSDRCIMYDGPGFDWHGMFPGISFTVDSWPWEPLGFSLMHDGYEIQDALNKIARGNMDKVSAQMNPSLAFDTNATNMSEARRFDPYKPNDRVGFDGNAIDGEPFRATLDPAVTKVTPESMAMMEKLEQVLDHQMGVTDAMTLAKMRTVGSMDELEKVMEANGPIIEMLSRGMEPPMRDLGVMVKYLIMQYYSTARVMQDVGPDGVTPDVFDYDPTSLVPSHMPGETAVDSGGAPISSAHSPIVRARTFADNLRFFILPNSLHEMSQMVMKLGLIQLRKAGIMIDSQTIAEAWNVPSYGTIPGSTVIERYHAEKEMELEQMARMKAIADGLGLTAPPGMPPAAPPGAPKPNGSGPEGRPPSGGAPPKLVQKDSGARSTIAESK
jgi:hypothetical protein